MPWAKNITKIMLQRQINQAVDEFALSICEALDQLRAQLRTALSELKTESGSPAVEHLHSALDYIEGLMTVLKCETIETEKV